VKYVIILVISLVYCSATYTQDVQKYAFDYTDQWDKNNGMWGQGEQPGKTQVIFNYKQEMGKIMVKNDNKKALYTLSEVIDGKGSYISFIAQDEKENVKYFWYNNDMGLMIIFNKEMDEGIRFIQRGIFNEYLSRYDASFRSYDTFIPSFQLKETTVTSNEEIIGEPVGEEIYVEVEVFPQFPGGMNGLMNFLATNIRYPSRAIRKGIQGRVLINFIIEKDGSISSARVLKGIGGGCDEEALRVINAMPDWKPGTIDGKPVRVAYNLPVKFTL
jgi:TonB family protein